MRGEVIAIGDELTSGQRLDTNSRWISQQLGDLGIQTVFHTTVGDDLGRNIAALQTAASRADIVICTGGLGPTQDDLTRQAMADAFGVELFLDEDSLAKIKQMFAARSREMPERNRVQAMFPQGSRVIPNPHGSAPGIDMSVTRNGGNCRLFALPGVPAEMQQMWLETVVPRMEQMIGSELGNLRYHAIKLFGIGESDVEVKLPDLIERDRNPSVGITVSRATITLRIAGRAQSEAEFQQLIAPTVQEIHNALGDLVFGHGEDELQDAVLRLLEQKETRMATVELGAASWIGDWMLAANGTAGRFAGSIALPNLYEAQRWLRGPADVVACEPATPANALWAQLAREAQSRFGCHVALVVGIYPTMEEMSLATGPFDPYFAAAVGDQLHVIHRPMGGHPDVLGPRIAKTGLDLVRRALAGLPIGE